MNSLHIDLNYNSTIFIVFNNITKEHKYLFKKNNNDVVDTCIETLEQFLESNQLDIRNIENIYFNIGPGTYTGTKATINLVKTIYNVFKNKRFYCLNGLEILSGLNGISIIDAKGNKSFIGIYKQFQILIEPMMVLNDELNNYLNQFNDLKTFKEQDLESFYLSNFFQIVDKFIEQSNVLGIKPLYLKDPV